jgi:hypothetical protein
MTRAPLLSLPTKANTQGCRVLRLPPCKQKQRVSPLSSSCSITLCPSLFSRCLHEHCGSCCPPLVCICLAPYWQSRAPTCMRPLASPGRILSSLDCKPRFLPAVPAVAADPLSLLSHYCPPIPLCPLCRPLSFARGRVRTHRVEIHVTAAALARRFCRLLLLRQALPVLCALDGCLVDLCLARRRRRRSGRCRRWWRGGWRWDVVERRRWRRGGRRWDIVERRRWQLVCWRRRRRGGRRWHVGRRSWRLFLGFLT